MAKYLHRAFKHRLDALFDIWFWCTKDHQILGTIYTCVQFKYFNLVSTNEASKWFVNVLWTKELIASDSMIHEVRLASGQSHSWWGRVVWSNKTSQPQRDKRPKRMLEQRQVNKKSPKQIQQNCEYSLATWANHESKGIHNLQKGNVI